MPIGVAGKGGKVGVAFGADTCNNASGWWCDVVPEDVPLATGLVLGPSRTFGHIFYSGVKCGGEVPEVTPGRDGGTTSDECDN